MLALDELGLVQPPISCRVLFYCGYIGMMEKKMETTMMGYIYIGIILGFYWGYIGIMEERMETTQRGYKVYIGIFSPYTGESNGKENKWKLVFMGIRVSQD